MNFPVLAGMKILGGNAGMLAGKKNRAVGRECGYLPTCEDATEGLAGMLVREDKGRA